MIADLQTSSGNTGCKPVSAKMQARLDARIAARPQVSFCIPPDEQAEFAQRVTAKERARVLRLLTVLEDIHAQPKITEACRYQAALLKRHGARGWSYNRLRAVYYAYTKTGFRKHRGGELLFQPGDWRMLSRYHAQLDAGLSGRREFIQFWRKLVEGHQRVTSQAFKELVQIWETGFDFARTRYKAIPGYPEWPEPEPATGLPAGWLNLRQHVPDRYELVSARLGIQAASGLGLKLSTTRVGLRLFEFIECDDHEWNVKVNFPGQLKAMRPRGFGAADVLTSRCFTLMAKPTLWDATEEVKKVLNEREFLWFVLGILTTTGYRIDERGTTFLLEHGTATIREAVRAIITRLTGGKVKFKLSGRFHRPAHGGQFAAPSGGNFRFKAIIECYWRLIDDALDFVKGQTGKDRNHAPEEMERADADNTRLLQAAAALPPERAALIRFNRVTWAQFNEFLFAAQNRIDADTRHEIEGWEKLGFIAEEFRVALDAGWQPAAALLALPEAEQGAVAERVNADDQLFRVRKLSRAEAYARAHAAERGNLRTLPLEVIPEIVGLRNAVRGGQPVPVIGGRLSFDNQDIDSDGLAFLALDAAGKPLREGAEFICFVNPLQPDALIACDAKLRVISICPPVPKPARNDEAGIQRALGVQRHWQAEKQAPQRARWADEGAALKFAKEHNAALCGDRVKPDRVRTEPAAKVPDVDVAELVRQRAERAENSLPAEVAWEG